MYGMENDWVFISGHYSRGCFVAIRSDTIVTKRIAPTISFASIFVNVVLTSTRVDIGTTRPSIATPRAYQ